MNQKITFFIQGNGDDDFIPQQGTLADLLLKIHFFLCPRTKFIPSDFLIIERLRENKFQSGAYDMHWQINDIDLSAENLANTNQGLINKGYIKPAVPNWVIDKLTWNAFLMQELRGIPPQNYLPLFKCEKLLSQQLESLENSHDEKYFELYRQLRTVENEITDLFDNYPIKQQYLFDEENP